MMPITDRLLANKKLEMRPATENDIVVKLCCLSDHCVRLGELQKLTHLIIRLHTHQYFSCHLLKHLPNLVSLHLIPEEEEETCANPGWDNSRTTRRALAAIREPPKDHKIPSCLSSGLKVIEIRGLNGFDDEIQLALAYLLKNGRVLSELNLLYHSMSADPTLLCSSSTIQKNLQKLSSNCRVTVAAVTMTK